jgi:hypothetical protein
MWISGETPIVKTTEQNETNEFNLDVVETKALNTITSADKTLRDTVIDNKFPNAKDLDNKFKDQD